jgi:leucine dehydrogenase
MKVFERLQDAGYEQLVFCQDEVSGLKAIICIHDTTLGPALGGLRMWNYNSEEDAIEDVLRLAKGMTYKAAVAGLNHGGGKAVIIGDARKDKSESLFRMFGRYVEGLNGRYITAEDVGTTETDMELIHLETSYVTGYSSASGSAGNPSPATAFGVYQGIRAAAYEVFGDASLEGKTIAVQGIGNVAFRLLGHLAKEGAKLIVTDIVEQQVAKAIVEYGATTVSPDEIYDVECDFYAPCALGAVINDKTIDRLKCKVIAGAANNQLHEPRHGELLQQRGILYVPDYVINAGGVIHVADELTGYNQERVMQKVAKIYDTVLDIFAIAKREQLTTHLAASHLAEERIAKMKHVYSRFNRNPRHALNMEKASKF